MTPPIAAEWPTPYQDARIAWQLHTDLLRVMTPCFHGVGANHPFPQNGCPCCTSTLVVARCERIMAAVAPREAVAA